MFFSQDTNLELTIELKSSIEILDTFEGNRQTFEENHQKYEEKQQTRELRESTFCHVICCLAKDPLNHKNRCQT